MNEYDKNTQFIVQDLNYSFTKSWLAYVKPTAIFVFIFLLGLGLTNGNAFTLIVLAVIIAVFLYKILYLKSFELYTDKRGCLGI